jgi:hypothetical protein
MAWAADTEATPRKYTLLSAIELTILFAGVARIGYAAKWAQ